MSSATLDVDRHVREIRDHDWRMLVGGELVHASGGRRYNVENPATEELIASIPDAEVSDVSRAVDEAAKATASWWRTAARDRGDLVRELARVLVEHTEELAWLDTLDGGFPLWMTRVDVRTAADRMNLFAGWAMELKGYTVPTSAEHLHFTEPAPYGVVARIIPFNHPIMFAASKIAAPLVAGNCVVLKPSEQTPLSALRMGELFADLLPPGVLSIVSGSGPRAGQALVRHPNIFRIAFTGSQATGREIQQSAAKTGVKFVTLELGGKNAMIVFPDADLDAAVTGAIKGMNFAFAGQSCGSTSRLLLHESIADDMLSPLAAAVRAVRVGQPADEATNIGPVISRTQFERVLSSVDSATREGARVLSGGCRALGLDRGYFIAPTLLANVTPDMRIAREEIFGPVLSVLQFTDEDDAIRIANGVDYGLTGSVWTRDVARAHRVAHELEAGYIWVNDTSTHFVGLPFGGVKGSGTGREESLEELLSYTQIKTINVSLT